MSKINDLSQGNLGDITRRQHKDQYATPLNGASVGSGGTRYYGTGKLRVENEGLEVSGTATITGILNANGTVNLTGIIGISGPLTVTGATALNGPTTVGGNTTVNGTLTTNGATDINGNLTVDGTAAINGAATLNNNLTVAGGRKITVGGLTLENTGAGGGQVNFPGGSITASSTLGMLINHGTVEIAGTVVKLSSLPTIAQPANLHVSASGQVFKSTV